MATAEAPSQDLLLNADACGDHQAELAIVQLQQQVLKRVLAAQDKLDVIRGEYTALGSLFHEIRDLKADEPLLRPQKNFFDSLILQEEGLDALATSLIRFLD